MGPGLTEGGWRLVALGGESVPAETGGRPIELRFADGKVQGSSGCNRVSGAYTLAGDSLRFGPLATTKMACPAMELEHRFLEALQSTARWRIASGALELLDASGRTLARFLGSALHP
jgi:heat shock protein HslJ